MKTLLIPVLLLIPTSLFTMSESRIPATLTEVPPTPVQQQEAAKVDATKKDVKDPFRQ